MAQSSRALAPAHSQPQSSAPFLSLRHVSHALPDGRILLNDVSHDFDGSNRYGLIGRNGAGKSVLLRLANGAMETQSGRIVRSGRIAYVPQEQPRTDGTTLADIAGIVLILRALSSIEAGSTCQSDFDLTDGHWRIRDEWTRMLADAGLPAWQPDHPASIASGGELTRVALAGALMQTPDALLLDEPSNHLDAGARRWLMDQIDAWRGGLIVVSHDRTLLDAMSCIVELDRGTLSVHSGNYTAYRDHRDRLNAAHEASLAHARNERTATLRTLRQQHDAQQQRNARDARKARDANQAPILLGMKKANAEAHAGRENVRRQDTVAALDDAVRQAAAQIDQSAGIALALPETAVPPGRRVLHLEHAKPPYPADVCALTMTLSGPFRLAIRGPNGCGKSTLLSMLAGELAPHAGVCDVRVPTAMLDQRASVIPEDKSLLETLQVLGATLAEGELRSRLALLGLGPELVNAPAATLSGGERLKAALACALWRKTPAQLLLLDEPTNHLDIESAEAMEKALRAYPGAMVVVSHDEAFLEGIAPTHEMVWGIQGWRVTAE
ncbi:MULTISPECIES: ABC-F family ATP-binding cassette domain-containing protein [Achromobacter]|uniref:ABC-F family ATP-binding cassette domain-containing protein n=1 Tax=Achromobacter TaxID=222 RepID=UPI001C4664C4|nr:ABC-F family ATP-binding cassette domain-containing protein [Achromobacter sp. ACM05]MBV7502417.1 ATP-binding cassette domain-containing protein [Achromobacter sp. ACM05]